MITAEDQGVAVYNRTAGLYPPPIILDIYVVEVHCQGIYHIAMDIAVTQAVPEKITVCHVVVRCRWRLYRDIEFSVCASIVVYASRRETFHFPKTGRSHTGRKYLSLLIFEYEKRSAVAGIQCRNVRI